MVGAGLEEGVLIESGVEPGFGSLVLELGRERMKELAWV